MEGGRDPRKLISCKKLASGSFGAVNFGVTPSSTHEMESMDLVESDSSGIPLTSSVNDISSYAASYLESFLPAYQMVNQSPISGVADRYRAIKFAADASLALTATGASWSDALSKMLVGASERNNSAAAEEDFSSNEVEFSRRSDAGLSSSEASISSCEQSPDLDGNDLREHSGSSEPAKCGRKLGVDSRNLRNGVAGGRLAALQRLAGRRARRNLARHRRLSHDASRLAILRTLSTICKSKRRQGSTKPRAVVRKVKSLAKSRRRLPTGPKPAERVVEPEQRFEDGLAALQRLVPGGSNMDAALLLDEAADFVIFLKLQVQA